MCANVRENTKKYLTFNLPSSKELVYLIIMTCTPGKVIIPSFQFKEQYNLSYKDITRCGTLYISLSIVVALTFQK